MTTNTTPHNAQAYAHAAHDSIEQKRKYTGLPYWVHTDEVASIVATVTNDADIIAAAHLHDVLEDVLPLRPEFSYEDIRTGFGERVASMVFDLTDQYISENYPDWNRKTRKQKERERLGAIHPDSKLVKLADLISNTKDIVVNDPNFAITYLKEKGALLPELFEPQDPRNAILWARAAEAYTDGCKKLGVNQQKD